MIEVVALAVAGFGAALFKHLTARELLKRADKKDLPAIARAIYPRHQLGRGGRAGNEASQQGGEAPVEQPDRGT